MAQSPFSALGRAVWDETTYRIACAHAAPQLSVLSVEPYGMKQMAQLIEAAPMFAFSALGRAVWDETKSGNATCRFVTGFQCSRSSRMG